MRLPLTKQPAEAVPADDDLMVLADAVRAIGLQHDQPAAPASSEPPKTGSGRGGHLRLVPVVD